jgi:hypothetical protein
MGVPDSMTRFVEMDVPTGSEVSTGVDKNKALVRTSESLCDSEDAPSEYPTHSWLRLSERMLITAFASLSISNSHAGQECSRTHNGLSVFIPQDTHSFVVSVRSTATKAVPSRPQLCFRSACRWEIIFRYCSQFADPCSFCEKSPWGVPTAPFS